MNSNEGYQKTPIPKSRKLIIEMCDYALKKHRMHGLFEADVTKARKKIQRYKKKTGESFTAGESEAV